MLGLVGGGVGIEVEGVAVVPFTGGMKEWFDWVEVVSGEVEVEIKPVRVMPEITTVGWIVTVW